MMIYQTNHSLPDMAKPIPKALRNLPMKALLSELAELTALCSNQQSFTQRERIDFIEREIGMRRRGSVKISFVSGGKVNSR
jgi:hypothetical protein